ncbi:MAG: hypothetical protein J5634_02315 [Bacilli bacterium]|nr:hypothetical protein [Bacilli bacterium]
MKNKISILVLVMLTFLCVGCSKKVKKPDNKPKPEIPDVDYTDNFNINLIKVTRRNKNYLVSPYSIEIALNMLKEGASGETKKQIEKVVPERKINDVSIKNKVKIANALFIKDEYKNKIKKSFSNKLVQGYNSEVLYDKFKNPDVINNWVDKNTDGMIKKVVDYIDSDFVLGLANAIAIDVKWYTKFDCMSTLKNEFTKENGDKINVEMMHNTFDTSGFKYLKSDDAVGVIMPYESYNKKTGKEDYENGVNLEFVGILPNEDVDTYIKNLTEKSLNKLLDSGKSASSKFEINVSLPRFKYSYEVPNFIEVLLNMGIKDAFDAEKADFTNILAKEDMKTNLFVGEAVHKTYIDLNESGTKAAAVTYFGLKDMAAVIEEDKETININFNKPFVYMIRDKETKEILFFGAVYEPNLWNGSTCSEK